ncbi:hypothetical protein [Xanthomonas arboricola]|uniref:hypothetical protein n=1 Tax=Xanthomonas arboricola TaxID=56448 RepID=UPI001ABBA268|nr:hypothetical protein [Xanthomonas arboricola]
MIQENYKNDLDRASFKTGYSVAKIKSWISGQKTPQKVTVSYFLQCALVPEFKVIAEYKEFDSSAAVQGQLKKILGEHAKDPGIYAFYDSFGSLVYIGKAKCLLAEINSALGRSVTINFPKGVKRLPETRKEVVRFISAYDVGATEWGDYPKHVESLILRISKPILNKNIGSLGKAFKMPREA